MEIDELAEGLDKLIEDLEIAGIGNLAPTWSNVNILQECQTRLRLDPAIQVGSIIRWKEGMDNRRTSGIFVVTEMFPTPAVSPEDDSGVGRYMEPFHGKYGTFSTRPDGKKDFIEYVGDFRRMEMVPESDLK